MPETWGQGINKRTFTNAETLSDILVDYVDTTTLYASQLITAPATTYSISGAAVNPLSSACLLPGTTFYRSIAADIGDTLPTTPTLITAIEQSLGQTCNQYESYPLMLVSKNTDSVSRTYTLNFNADALTILKGAGTSVAIATIAAGKTYALQLRIMRLSTTQIMILV